MAASTTSFIISNISQVAASNAKRSDEGKDMALLVYAFVGLSHVLMSLEVALVISWRVPESVLSLMPYAKDVRVATFYWWYAWLSMTFLISCAGGTVTMFIIVLVYCFIVFYVIFDALCNCRMRCAVRNRPPDRGGRSLAAQQRIDWLLSGGRKGISEEQLHQSIKAKKKEGGAANAGVNSPANVSFLDMDKIPIFVPLDVGSAVRLPQKDEKKALEKVAGIIKLGREGTDDKKKPWTYYPDHNPDGTASDTQIALEEAAAWKVRRAFGDTTDMTENGQLRDADSGVIVGSQMETAMRLARMLMRYSPGSLENMEQVLESYRLQEDRLFTDLESKYGPEPTRLERKRWVGQQRARGSMTAEDVAKSFTVPELPKELYWTRCPVRPVPPQLAAMITCGIFIILCAVGLFAAVWWWPIAEYRVVVDVVDGSSGGSSKQRVLMSVPEVKPDLTAKAEFLIYGWPGTASEMRIQQYLNFLSRNWYSYIYYKPLKTDEEKQNWILKPFIEAYNVDMTAYVRQSYTEYSTTDDWWGRQVLYAKRPLAVGSNTTGSIICPSDARYTAWPNVQRARRFWIKGGRFSYEELVNGKYVEKPIHGNPDYFNGGTLLLARLATADYHRFHAPVSGKVLEMYSIFKHHFSNTPTAVQSGNNVLFNMRWVILIDTDGAAEHLDGIHEAAPAKRSDVTGARPAPESMGVVAMVIIGSTFTGSVEFGHRNYTNSSWNETAQPLSPGTWVRAGDELGRFKLGGSTVALVFRAGAVKFRCDVLSRSTHQVETLLKMGEQIGVNRGTVNADDPDYCI